MRGTVLLDGLRVVGKGGKLVVVAVVLSVVRNCRPENDHPPCERSRPPVVEWCFLVENGRCAGGGKPVLGPKDATGHLEWTGCQLCRERIQIQLALRIRRYGIQRSVCHPDKASKVSLTFSHHERHGVPYEARTPMLFEMGPKEAMN